LVILASAALVALAASPAFAQSTVTINGSIAPACSGGANTTFSLNNITDPSGAPGTLNSAAVNKRIATLAGVTCNGAGTTMLVTATPLLGPVLPAGAEAAGFSRTVQFIATVNKGSGAYVQKVSGTAVATHSTDDAAPTIGTPVGLINGNLTVDLTEATAEGILIASSEAGYSATVTVALTAGI
jgi:hypothetical protein